MATTTAAKQRAQAKAEYDVFLSACPSRELLDRVSDKWVSLILIALRDGSKRYSELSRQIAGVSPKMLTQTLRNLERDGLIIRNMTLNVPVRVDYSLTVLGESLIDVLGVIKVWAETNMEHVAAARQRYDENIGG